jgi:hypothetical protein
MFIQCARASLLCKRAVALRMPRAQIQRGLRGAEKKSSLILILTVLRRPGGYVEVSEPDPIPNSVVKRLRADGTSS